MISYFWFFLINRDYSKEKGSGLLIRLRQTLIHIKYRYLELNPKHLMLLRLKARWLADCSW